MEVLLMKYGTATCSNLYQVRWQYSINPSKIRSYTSPVPIYCIIYTVNCTYKQAINYR